MQNKNVRNILIAAVAIYGIIYFYQRYQRKKANESVVPYDEAIKKIDDL
jgi:preprotein translocase subunit YajC